MNRKKVGEIIDQLSRLYADRQDLEGIELYLINNPDCNYLKVDGTANTAWRKAVKSYVSELHRIKVWNNLMTQQK